MWANLPRHVGQRTPMRGKLAHVYLPFKSRIFYETHGYFIYFTLQKHEQKC